MNSNLYQACCCFSSYYPRATYEELDDNKEVVDNEKTNLNMATTGGEDYKAIVISNPSIAPNLNLTTSGGSHGAIVISNPSSSSFEPDISDENEEIAKLSSTTDLYNTNNLNHETDNLNMTPNKKGLKKSASNYTDTIQSEVSVQLTSWQSASFAMAHASTGASIKKKSSVDGGSNSSMTRSRSSSASGSSVSSSGVRRTRSRKRSKNPSDASGPDLVETTGRSSTLGNLKERFKEQSLEEEESAARLGLYASLNQNSSLKGKNSKSAEQKNVEKSKPKQEKQKLDEFTVMSAESIEMSVIEQADKSGGETKQEAKSLLISPITQPIKQFLGVFAPESATEAVEMKQEEGKELNDVSSEILSTTDSEGDDSYSIATSDISTDPTSAEEDGDFSTPFFPELYQTRRAPAQDPAGPQKGVYQTRRAPAQDPAGPQKSVVRSRQGSWVNRYPVLKPEEDSSSIATDDLSDTTSTNDQSSVFMESDNEKEGVLLASQDEKEGMLVDKKNEKEHKKDEIENVLAEMDEKEGVFSDKKDEKKEVLSVKKDEDKDELSDKKDMSKSVFSDKKDGDGASNQGSELKTERTQEAERSGSGSDSEDHGLVFAEDDFDEYHLELIAEGKLAVKVKEKTPDGNCAEMFVRYDPGTGEFVECDDSKLIKVDDSIAIIETDNTLQQQSSSASPPESDHIKTPSPCGMEEAKQVPELISPVTSSCVDDSTIVGSAMSSGGDTITTGGVKINADKSSKKKGGIVSKFKRKVLKK